MQDRLQCSGDTISSIVHLILPIFLTLFHVLVPPPPSMRRQSYTRALAVTPYAKFFKNCRGAVDGTMVPVHLPERMQPAFRCRKGFVAQNVFAACDFDMRLLFVLAGIEGSCCDSRLWQFAFDQGFTVPEGEFYLGDAGFALSFYCVTPYRGVRYHLKEFGSTNQRPRTRQEFFNYVHSKMRNVIERCFGLMKVRSQVLHVKKKYDLQTQVDFVYASAALHNFLRDQCDETLLREADEELERRQEEEHRQRQKRLARRALARARGQILDDDDDDDDDGAPHQADCPNASAWRDRLANRLWQQYQLFVSSDAIEG